MGMSTTGNLQNSTNHQHVFISYSTKDSVVAHDIVNYLERNGYKCWIAPRDISSGQDYSDVISDAMAESFAVVLVFSHNSAKSQFVKKEITSAVDQNKIIIPFKISNVELSGGYYYLLNNVQWIDATSKYESHLQDVINGIAQKPTTGNKDTGRPTKRNRKKTLILAICLVLIMVTLLFVVVSKLRHGDDHGMAQQSEITDSSAIIDTSSPKDTMPDTPEQGETTAGGKNGTDGRTPPGTTHGGNTKDTTELVIDTTTVEKPPVVPKNDYNQRKLLAKQLYNRGAYEAAQRDFVKLKAENPSDNELDGYISRCKEKIKGNTNE